jgi:polyhydroxyalkanoate synthase
MASPSSAQTSSSTHDTMDNPGMMTQEEWLKLMQEAQSAWVNASQHFSRQASTSPTASLHIGKAFMEMYAKMASDPARMLNQQAQFLQSSLQLWADSAQRFFGQNQADHTGVMGKQDKRFRDAAWEQQAVYSFLKNSYLLVREHLEQAVQDVDGLSPTTAKSVEFYTRQFLDALNPANSAITNPEVLRATIESKGENLRLGWQNLLNDMKEGRISMVDASHFTLGENIATTPGSVVFQNDLMQLIQYSPTTKEVYDVPILLTPAWINKYYILDLSPENSLIRWLTKQGFTVFCISWVNPDERYATTRFDDYMTHGPLAAMDVIEKATGSKQVHLAGYCLGGTLQAILLSYLHSKKQAHRVASATYLTTMIDFSEPGDLGVFIDEEQVSDLEQRMEQKGYLEGKEMAVTFNMLRAQDLIWSFVVNNYMLGKSPLPFDLLYWNADSTRLPAAMHSFYLRNMYLQNRLKDPGGIFINKIAVNLHQITTPSYLLSTREDHIAPWQTTYNATQIYHGETRFVLAASGHIAGVINPPEKKKYSYAVNENLPKSPIAWAEGATEHAGSWWNDWAAWLKPKSGAKVAARNPETGPLKVLEAAPGSYVKVKASG